MSTNVRGVEDRDAADWASLYTGYRTFYKQPEDAAAVEKTWQWVRAGQHGIVGLVAVDEQDKPIALANLRWFARPSTGTMGLYLDDLFTVPNARGRGAARALLDRASELAREGGANVVRWITAADNETARHLYDAVAIATPWVTYDMQPAQAAAISE
ncbi:MULTISPECIES: GNAT family N-acetyltransferase [unclassified Curtobacterium]|uniref:GNAT family N-acetyltransferase n=1 Tax=unclassified Curtobacterium TaxID=257496 RepID=UPI000DA7C2B5|nr:MULTISPECIES: GNAT family N-acetyltransferase [unclassified Curtobacterium]WIB65951.1 GNAT family N-acetyltransferase [Curtobacterium sp. MCBD17_040]WIB69166.1 GNAT family N-acetyltransferase [Curtobacterium sp. MCBD17_035]